MDCLGFVESGNYAFYLCSIFESKGIILEVLSAPCKIARGGCSYCIKFPEEMTDTVIEEGLRNNIRVNEVYLIKRENMKNNYIRIRPKSD